MEVPFLDLGAPHQALKEDILPLWEEILISGRFVGGEHVESFEDEFAAACGVRHAVAVSSGTDALRFILLALDLHPGDEVITAPNTFLATAEAISQAGGTPVFADVLPGTLNLDPAKAEAAISPKTKGIVPVHLYGQTAEMDPILEVAKAHGLWVVEDAAQAHLAEYKGRKAGSLGTAAAFSFYPGKNLGACGEAGAVTVNDPDIADRIRILRDHGQDRKYHHECIGYNGRCDALQAAALRVKLKHLSAWNEARRRHAAAYAERLASLPELTPPSCPDHMLPVWHLYVVQVPRRDHVVSALHQDGVGTGLHYPIPVHLQQAYAPLHLPRGSYPVAEAAADRILSLPMFPGLTEAQLDHVCGALARALDVSRRMQQP